MLVYVYTIHGSYGDLFWSLCITFFLSLSWKIASHCTCWCLQQTGPRRCHRSWTFEWTKTGEAGEFADRTEVIGLSCVFIHHTKTERQKSSKSNCFKTPNPAANWTSSLQQSVAQHLAAVLRRGSHCELHHGEEKVVHGVLAPIKPHHYTEAQNRRWPRNRGSMMKLGWTVGPHKKRGKMMNWS